MSNFKIVKTRTRLFNQILNQVTLNNNEYNTSSETYFIKIIMLNKHIVKKILKGTTFLN